jgi:hypothetical protein
LRKSQLKGVSKSLVKSVDDQILSSILSTASCNGDFLSPPTIETKHGVGFCTKCCIFGKIIMNSRIIRESRSRSHTDTNSTSSSGTSTIDHLEAADILTEVSELVYDLKKVNDIVNTGNEEEGDERNDKGDQSRSQQQQQSSF